MKRQPCRHRIVASAASRKLSAASQHTGDRWGEKGEGPDTQPDRHQRKILKVRTESQSTVLAFERKKKGPTGHRSFRWRRLQCNILLFALFDSVETVIVASSLLRTSHLCPVFCLQPVHKHVGVTIRQEYNKTASVRCRHAVSASRQNTTKGSHFIS